MSAYLISEVKIINETLANKYRKLAALSIDKYGGKYIVRGAEPIQLEGEKRKNRVVIVEFPTIEILKEWYSSKEYKKALKYRDEAIERILFYVEGI